MWTRKPSKIIGPSHDPYMLRWNVFKVGKLPRVYLHRFMRSDDDRALHDHPWWFVSIILKGEYLEYTENAPNPHPRHRFSVAYRPLNWRHRVALVSRFNKDGSYGPQPCWALFITGPIQVDWGFWCPDFQNGIYVGEHRVPWNEFDGCE